VRLPAMADSTQDPMEEAIDRIILDIKTLVELEESEEATAKRLRERLLASHDADIKRFLSSLEPYRPLWPWGQMLIGAGELALAAFLTVIGLILIVPSILGFTSRGDIGQYLSDLVLGLSASGLSDPLVLALGFGFGLFLLLTALYTLRQASRSFGQSGLVPPSA